MTRKFLDAIPTFSFWRIWNNKVIVTIIDSILNFELENSHILFISINKFQLTSACWLHKSVSEFVLLFTLWCLSTLFFVISDVLFFVTLFINFLIKLSFYFSGVICFPVFYDAWFATASVILRTLKEELFLRNKYQSNMSLWFNPRIRAINRKFDKPVNHYRNDLYILKFYEF